MFRVALLSRWHVHSHKNDQRYVKEFLSQPDCAVTCVWDRNEGIAREWAEEYGVPYSTDLETVISREDVDGVIVTSAVNEHKEIYSLAAKYKKHIFTEKVLSLSLDEAIEMRNIIKESGIKFCIAFTRLSAKQLVYAKKVAESGEIGDIVSFRCFCSHAGGIVGFIPEYCYDPDVAGGGAMIDMGFNSLYLARYIMGEVESVSSNFSDEILHKQVEDTAICSLKFKNKAIGTIESSFCTPSVGVFELAIYGTKGAYYARFGGNDCALLNVAGKPPRKIPFAELSDAPLSPVVQWVRACTLGESDELCGIDEAVEMVRFMTAAYRSAKEEGRMIKV